MISLSSSRGALFLQFFILLCSLPVCIGAKALSVTPSLTWYGNDGGWSAISVRVGTPQQWVDLMVSTASSETWLVSPSGCDGSSTCQSKRGGLFDSKKSKSWQIQGTYELGLDPQLGLTGSGDYGLDVLELGSTGVSLNRSMIASINDTQYWLGHFGLGISPANFTTIVALSPISDLVENEGSIPSHSYGFTAGAIYQGKSEPCSLTLGGFDANRFIPHNISFELNPQKQPQAYIQSISVQSGSTAVGAHNWSSNPLQLQESVGGISVIIDSSTPFLWLPESTCEKFARAFGLTYNDSLQLYTFDGNASRHADLRSWNLEFTFSLSDTSKPSQIVNITLPYAAFDLQLTFPFIPNTTYGDPNGNKYYFPLRRAANETQYTIGRAFLQEAYLITDYERNNFSIYQAVHIADPVGNTSIVDITRPSTSQFTDVRGVEGSGLSRIAIVLIALGVALFFALLALVFYLYRRRSRHLKNKESKPEPSSPTISVKEQGDFTLACEADGVETMPPVEVTADPIRFELAVPEAPIELDNTSVSVSEGSHQRYRGWNEGSVSDRSPSVGATGSYLSVGTNSYSAISSPESSIVNYSSLSPPPPRYQSLSERVEQPQESRALHGHVYGRQRRFGAGKIQGGGSLEEANK